jgi:hypothetical protein
MRSPLSVLGTEPPPLSAYGRGTGLPSRPCLGGPDGGDGESGGSECPGAGGGDGGGWGLDLVWRITAALLS